MLRRFHWKLKQREIILGDHTQLMGILNVTPDSFSDGGLYSDPDKAAARALELEEQGATIIDIGAESTRPGSQRISEGEELRRLIPVLKRLRNRLNIPISVDTYKSQVAEKALEHGAEIINDPTGLLLDLQLPKVVNKYSAGLIINHMRGTPETWATLGPMKNLMRSLAIDLEAAMNRARQAGVQKHQIVLDPGLGFGKRREQNFEIIAKLPLLHGLDQPLLVGPSRKAFLKKDDPTATEFGTAAAVTASILNGAHIVRVHDVTAMRSVVDAADAIQAAAREPEPEKSAPAPPRPRTQPVLLSGEAPQIKRPATRRPPLKRAGNLDSNEFRADRERRGE